MSISTSSTAARTSFPRVCARKKAGEGINVARADFYPNVNLAAVVGIQTLGLGAATAAIAFARASGPGGVAAGLLGRPHRSAYRGARAEYDEAVALYNDSLTTALREVADALNDRRAIEGRTG